MDKPKTLNIKPTRRMIETESKCTRTGNRNVKSHAVYLNDVTIDWLIDLLELSIHKTNLAGRRVNSNNMTWKFHDGTDTIESKFNDKHGTETYHQIFQQIW